MIDNNKLIELNKSGLTQREIAKELNVSRATIQRALRKLGIHTPNYHNTLKFDNTVFNCIDTEEKAYWLGFLFADGSVSSTNNNIELSLSVKDLSHLEKFKLFLNSSTKIKVSTITVNNKNFDRCRLTVTDKYFKEKLISLGCTPRKSLTIKFPNEHIFKYDYLKYDFIRGYVDGDGCISYTRTGRLSLSIIGTKEFLQEIKQLFPLSFGKAFIKDKRWKNNTYYISCSANNADIVLTKLYKDSTIYLERKYNRLAVLSSNW